MKENYILTGTQRRGYGLNTCAQTLGGIGPSTAEQGP